MVTHMTNKKIDNTLYIHLASVINQALPLEYAIRAARQANPREMEQLAEIGEQIEQYWLALGASEQEIQHDRLVDLVWDVLQVGLPMSRRHDRVFADRVFVELINKGLAGARAAFGEALQPLRLPATDYFRICDLLNGNDIAKLLTVVARRLHESRTHQPQDDIALEKFVHGVREPIRLHPGLEFVTKHRSDSPREVERFGIVLDTEMAFDTADLQRLVREFLYQFAQRRQALRAPTAVDPTSEKLIQAFLTDDLLGRVTPHKADRMNSLLGPLAGLQCWDLVEQYRQEEKASPVDDAVAAVLAILHPKDKDLTGHAGMKKNFYTARTAINSLPFSGAAPISRAKRKLPPKANS